MLSVSQAWRNVKSRVKNIGDISASEQLYRASIVNREIREEIESANPTSIIKAAPDVILTSGVQTILKPTDFQDIKADGTGLFIVDEAGGLGDPIPKVVEGQSGSGYFETLTGFTIQGFEKSTIRQKYIPTIDDFLIDSETFVVGERFRDLIETGLLVQYYKLKGNLNDVDYQNWSVKYDSLLSSFSDSIRSDSSTSSLEDHSSTYG